MLKHLKTVLLTSLLAFNFVLVPATVGAAGYSVDGSKSDACAGIGLTGADCGSNADGRVTGLLKNIVNLISVIVGIAAVIMIVIGGFKYVTSAGDTNNVASAKSTLIYAVIGLIIVALAQFIVNFVLKNI